MSGNLTAYRRTCRGLRIAALALAALGGSAGIGLAIEPEAREQDKFGEVFIHPRDRHFLPENAPSRAERQSQEKVFDAERGTMFRYEYKKGNTTIYRDVWEDPDLGQRGSFGLRFKF